jgi:hypothetical protein
MACADVAMVEAKPTAINLSMVSCMILQEWSFLKHALNSEIIDPVSNGNCSLTKRSSALMRSAMLRGQLFRLTRSTPAARVRDLRHPLLLRDGAGERSKFDGTIFGRKQIGDSSHAAQLAYRLLRRLSVQIPIDFAKKS